MLGRIDIVQSFQSAAPPDTFWAALEAAPRWPDVQPDIIAAAIEPDGALCAGAIIRTVARPGTQAADMSYRVVEAERPRRLAIESGGRGLHFRARTEYRIESDGTGTRLTLAVRVEPVLWLHKLTTQLARRWYTERMTENLKSRIEPLLRLAERIATETNAPSA